MRIIRRAMTMALALTSQAAAQSHPTLDAVARAMGGKERVLGARTLVVEATGDNYNFGQNHTPEAPLGQYAVTQSRRTIDFANKRWALDQTREPRFAGANSAPQRQRFGIDGDIAFNVGNTDVMQRVGGQTAVDRANELLHHPVGFVQAAYGTNTEVFEDRVDGGNWRIRINPGGNKIEMFVDGRTMLPLNTRKHTYQPMLGDVMLELAFADWQDTDGLKLPARITTRLDDRWVLSEYRASAMRVNADASAIAATPQVRGTPAPTPPPPNVVVEEIAPGVWSLAGQSHHTIAIERANEVWLVEAPQSEARTRAAIERARELRPGKAVTTVINTHHHFDHSGGIRAAISEGLIIATHAGNREFYERTVFPRRHFIVKDALAANPRPLRLMPIGDRVVRADSLRPIEMYQVTGSEHSGTMLIVYLPAERLLIQADLYNPPAANATTVPAFPFVKGLVDNVQRRGLQVDRVVGIHGRVVPWSDVLAAAARQP
jgi:glyoxylase-like metal-dependent hydrolase (beta-lactamase superfamily II)